MSQDSEAASAFRGYGTGGQQLFMLFCSFLIIASIIAINKMRFWQIRSRWCQNWLQDGPVELESHNTYKPDHLSDLFDQHLTKAKNNGRVEGALRQSCNKSSGVWYRKCPYFLQGVLEVFRWSKKCLDDWMILTVSGRYRKCQDSGWSGI